jgi:hypothetical protein
VGIATALLALGAASSAHAIPARPSYWRFANGDAPIAQDGVFLFVLERTEQSTFLEPMIMLLDPMDGAVAGVIELVTAEGESDMRIFRPSAALEMIEGSYTLLGDFEASPLTFQASTSPIAEGMPLGAISVNQGVTLEVTQQSCCRPPSVSIPGITGTCVSIRSRQRPHLQVVFTSGPTDSSARQFVYRAQLTENAQAEGTWRSATDAASGWLLTAAELAEEYCYRVEAHRLTDGEAFVLEEACVARTHGPLEEVGPDESMLRAQLGVQNCSDPSMPLAAAWCEVNRAACAEPANESACAVAPYAQLCAGFSSDGKTLVELVEEGIAGEQAGAGGANAGAGGAAGTTSGGAGGAAGKASGGAGGASGAQAAGASGADMPAGAARSTGCSALPRPVTLDRFLGASLCALLAAALWSARRRERS